MNDNKCISSKCALLMCLMLLATSLLCEHAVYDKVNAESAGFGKGRTSRRLGNLTTGAGELIRETHNKSFSVAITRNNGNRDDGDVRKISGALYNPLGAEEKDLIRYGRVIEERSDK